MSELWWDLKKKMLLITKFDVFPLYPLVSCFSFWKDMSVLVKARNVASKESVYVVKLKV